MSQWEKIKSKPGVTHVPDIIKLLSPAQQKCITQLSDEWSDTGYDKLAADLIYTTDNMVLPGRFEPLVDCRLHRAEGVSPTHQHRLFPLGLDVKAYLENMNEHQ